MAGTFSRPLTPASLTITADNQTKVYGAALPALTVSYTCLVNGDTSATFASAPNTAPTVSTSAMAASPVAGGPYGITVSGAADSDYTISYVAGFLSVTPAVLTVTANNQSMVQASLVPDLAATLTGFQNNENLNSGGVTGTASLTTTATSTSPVGNYAITAAAGTLAAANYSFAFANGTLTIAPVGTSPAGPTRTGGCGCERIMVTTVAGASGGNPAGQAQGVGGVTAAGSVVIPRNDGVSSGQWTNLASPAGPAGPQATDNGSGQSVSQLPSLTQQGQTVVASLGGTDNLFFDPSGGSGYQVRFFGQETLAHDPTLPQFVLTDTTGTQLRFQDFSTATPTAQRGQLVSRTDADGNVTTVTSVTAAGRIGEVQQHSQTSPNAVESYLYAYVPSGANAGLVASVILRRSADGGSTWAPVREADYAYYDGSPQAHGNAGDLQTATVQDGTGQVLDTSYYRYYRPGESGGYAHGLKYVFNTQSYRRLLAALGDPTALTDAQVAPFADAAYAYDATHRVTQAVLPGAGGSSGSGQGTYAYSYTVSRNATDYNAWKYKTAETLPDGGQSTVYSNGYGEVMLQVFQDTTGKQ